ncbi:hypothetical protein KM043_016219 [Ampulex compressa]|nr:hypothetical protein KM043_016219 [Ampulex compressa]
MASSALFLLALVAFSEAAVLQFNDPRIVNGRDAKPGEIPYQVSLQRIASSMHFCGGSILNENYVITAAHCVAGNSPSALKVIAGTIDLRKPRSEHFVAAIIVHEEYNPADSWKNDVALLKVKTPFVKTQHVSFVTLPEADMVVNANDVAVVSGWGNLFQGGPTSVRLQRVNIYIAHQEYCKYMYKQMYYNVYDSQVCAFDPTVQKGSCHGDSGGPLTVQGTLIGLVSWARGCALTDYPTVYTRVSSHLEWIYTHAV